MVSIIEPNSPNAHVRAMVVDDESGIRGVVCDMLRDAGVSYIAEVRDGRAALQLMEDELARINFIVCDWNMPRMNGIDFLRQVRSIFPRMPFLMITGRGDEQSVIAARDAGVSGYIRKPFSPMQLSAKLAGLLQEANAKVMM